MLAPPPPMIAMEVTFVRAPVLIGSPSGPAHPNTTALMLPSRWHTSAAMRWSDGTSALVWWQTQLPLRQDNLTFVERVKRLRASSCAPSTRTLVKYVSEMARKTQDSADLVS